jgi:hypothetical protein
MTALTASTFTVAVVNPRLSDAQRLAQAVDIIRGRGDLVRPLVVMVNSETAIGILTSDTPNHPHVAEIIAARCIPATDFRFVQQEGAPAWD